MGERDIAPVVLTNSLLLFLFQNGTPETELDGVKFQLGGGLYDAPSGVTCYVTYPKADYAGGGTLRPRMSENALYRKRTIGTAELGTPFPLCGLF